MLNLDFFLDILNVNKGNSSLIWKNINNLTRRDQRFLGDLKLKVQGQLIEDHSAVASVFNNFFLDSVIELGKKFTKKILDIFPPDDSRRVFELVEVNEQQIKKIISSLKSSRSRDTFQLDNMFFKTHKDTLASTIAHIINLSFKNSSFPDGFKHAIVIPIFKSGDRLEASNHRPISILPVLSKIAEKVVVEQLTTFLSLTNSGLHCMQFGFRANHSTETATLHLIEQIKSRLDKGGVVGTVFLDLRKAFDTVNHGALLSKLSKLNFSSGALAWMSSYLNDRFQCVRVGDALSSNLRCTMGVPQGSVLGPLLFSIYINDLPEQCQDVEVQMYADDTVVYTHAKTAELAAAKLTAALDRIQHWLDQSCLSLNVSKTKGMFFSKTKVQPMVDILIKGERIDIVTNFKYLGVTLDSNLNFKKHVKTMVKSIKYNLANFRQIRNCLSLDAAKIFMHAMILSSMSYCITCWGQAGETAIRPIESLYKQTLKTLAKKPMHYHHCKILDKHNLLSFENFRLFSNLCLVYKILNGLAPPPLCDFVYARSLNSIRSTRISSIRDCHISFRRTVFGQSAFSVKASNQWNALPDDVRSSSSFSSFKTNLKRHLKGTQLCTH